MKQLPCRILLSCATLTLVTLAGMSARAETPALPLWQVLEYEQQEFFVTAKSRVEIAPASDDGKHWQLIANSSVANNSEQVVLDLAAADGRALQRWRLSKGKEERFKSYDFLPEHIVRVRRDPPANTRLPPEQWPVSSRREIAYPPLAPGVVVTDAYALLDLAGRFLASDSASVELVINTEFNFYRVRMTHGESASIKVKYQVAGAPAVSGNRQTRAVAVQVSPLGEQPDKPDFSLLGLNGDITVLFDTDSDLPLQLRGNAPRIGSTEINLKAVTLREPSA